MSKLRIANHFTLMLAEFTPSQSPSLRTHCPKLIIHYLLLQVDRYCRFNSLLPIPPQRFLRTRYSRWIDQRRYWRISQGIVNIKHWRSYHTWVSRTMFVCYAPLKSNFNTRNRSGIVFFSRARRLSIFSTVKSVVRKVWWEVKVKASSNTSEKEGEPQEMRSQPVQCSSTIDGFAVVQSLVDWSAESERAREDFACCSELLPLCALFRWHPSQSVSQSSCFFALVSGLFIHSLPPPVLVLPSIQAKHGCGFWKQCFLPVIFTHSLAHAIHIIM